MRFNVLGPLEIISDDGQPVHPQAPKVCQVIGLLLLNANETVSTDMLVGELWGERPPSSAMTTLQTYVYSARKTFQRELGAERARALLITRAPGYVMAVDRDELDITAFERLVDHARTFASQGRYEPAVRNIDSALQMWRGSVLSNVAAGSTISGHATCLAEHRLRAIELRIETLMQVGRHRELVADLRSLTVAHPFHEWFHEQLIRALSRSGRRAEALRSVRELRVLLAEELGLEPSEDVQRLQFEVLAGTAASVA
jgi:DNA-binding SARP family transcriptional activator